MQSFNIASAATFLGNAVRVNPSSNFDSLQSYYVKVDATAIDDTGGNSFPGINDNTTLNFTVADVAAPTLSSSSPADNATGVAVSANIVLTFNENVVAGSGNITLKKSSGSSCIQLTSSGDSSPECSNSIKSFRNLILVVLVSFQYQGCE